MVVPVDLSYATSTFNYQYFGLNLGWLTSMVAVELDRCRILRNPKEDFPNIENISKIIEKKLSLYEKNEFLIDPFFLAFSDTIERTCPDKKLEKCSETTLEMKVLNSELKNIKNLSDDRLKYLCYFFVEFNRDLASWYNDLFGRYRRMHSFVPV